MRRHIYVVSDLHLGGEAEPMCSERGQARLAAFFRNVAAEVTSAEPVHLILAGDVVDFLAESNDSGGWDSFTADEREAARKFARIVSRTKEVWKALRAAVTAGVHLSVLLGNHDIELSFAAVRRAMRDLIGPGFVEMIYDNEALRIGPVVIEHGNRYDAWNAVAHDTLRCVRSRSSRNETCPPFAVQPGSLSRRS
jgi:UDP-2,3-diacylglucosamine pyrophosphatase LpxH